MAATVDQRIEPGHQQGSRQVPAITTRGSVMSTTSTALSSNFGVGGGQRSVTGFAHTVSRGMHKCHRSLAADQRRLQEAQTKVLTRAEGFVHCTVEFVLMTVVLAVLGHTVYELISTPESVAQAAATAVNGVLFAVIIMEIKVTVMAHFERGGLQPQPFLIIGIISGVREMLSVGVRLSLQGSGQAATAGVVHLEMLELAVNGGLVLGLALALALLRGLGGMRCNTWRVGA